MDSHDAYRILIFTQNACLTEIFVIALQLLHIPYKMEQSPVAGLFKGDGPLNEHPHIGLPLGPRRLRRQVISVSGSFQKLLDELVDGKKFGALAVDAEVMEESLKFLLDLYFYCALRILPFYILLFYIFLLFLFCILPTRLMKLHIRIRALDLRQLHIRKAANHGFQHCRQRDILSGIIHDAKKIQQSLNLYRGKISGPGFCMGRNPRRVQHPGVDISPARQTAEQNHDIPIVNRPEIACVPIPDLSFAHDPADAIGCRMSLHLPVRQFGLVGVFCRGQGILIFL